MSLVRAFILLAAWFLGLPNCPAQSSIDAWTRSALNLPQNGSRVSLTHDLNGDGRRDCVALSGAKVLLFFQSPQGGFGPDPTHIVGMPPEWPVATIARTAPDKPASLLLLGPAGIAQWQIPSTAAATGGQMRPVVSQPLEITTGSQPLFLDLAADLDGDSIDEILLPFQDQLEILKWKEGELQIADTLNWPTGTLRTASITPNVQALGARFFETARLESRPVIQPTSLSRSGANFLTLSVTQVIPRTLILDWNQDKRVDILSSGRIWFQESTGLFQSRRWDGLAGLKWSTYAQGNRVRTVANLADFNGDGRLDTYQIDSVDSKLNPRTEFSVFLGRPDGTFTSRPDAVLRTRDVSASNAPSVGDLDGDGAPDVCLPHLDFQASSASSQMRTFFREGLRGELRFYCFDRARSRFPEAPVAAVPISVNYEMFGAAQLFRPLYAFHRDLTGDAKPDLVVKSGPSQVSIHANLGGRQGFSQTPQSTLSVAPLQVSDIEVTDLNDDQLADLVLTVYEPGVDSRLILAFFVSQPN